MTPTLLYMLRDANMNIVGLSDHRGWPVVQYVYNPHGQVRHIHWANAPPLPTPPQPGTDPNDAPAPGAGVDAYEWQQIQLAAAGNRVGHQGLHFERFDQPWSETRIPLSASLDEYGFPTPPPKSYGQHLVVRNGPMGFALPALLATSIYSGMIEYLADTAFNWWRRD